ncbi:TlpA disulfide reductase family protein [Lysobacter firmicutimachus]|uniref:TlpA disulfide reductase family protein n=1 Tax=Lysobacter firmicutimachus TaxID=1792846 RepID=A0AAU8MQU5_9GAMM
MSSPPDIPRPVSPTGQRWLWAALALASVLVVALGWQVGRMREDQRWLADRAVAPYVGMYVPRVALHGLDGRAIELGQPRGDSQVLFFFTTTCPYCRASLPQLKRVARQLPQASAGGAELIGVALASPGQARAYAREHALDFPLVAHDDRRTAALFRARKVPALLVIGRDGRVRYRHVGALNDKRTLRELLLAVRPAPPRAASSPAVAAAAARP